MSTSVTKERRLKDTKREATGVSRPDEKQFRENLNIETKKIEELKAELVRLKDKIEHVSAGRDEYLRRKGLIRSRLDELSAKIDTLEVEKKKLSDKLEKKVTEGKAIRQQVQSMKRSLGVASEEDISKKIKALEDRIMTETMSLKEEKRLLADIQQLKASRQTVSKFTITASENAADNNIPTLKVDLDTVIDQMRKLRQERKDARDELTKLLQQRQEATGPRKEIFNEIERVQRNLAERIATRQQLHQLYNAELRKWQQTQAREERAKRAAKAVEAQKLALQRQLEKLEDIPFEADVLLVEQTIQYVKKLVHERDSKNIGNDQANGNLHNNYGNLNEDGITLLPKSQRIEEFYCAPRKHIGEKKSNVLLKKTNKMLAYKHDIGTLSYFEECGVHAPVTENDLDDCLLQLQSKLAELKEKQKDGKMKYLEKRKELLAQIDAINISINASSGEKRTEFEDQLDNSVVNIVDTAITCDGTPAN